MAMFAAAAIAAGILPQCNGRRRAVNKQRYGWHMVAHQLKTCVCLPYRVVTIFTVRRSLHGICYSNSVCPSVRPSVRHTRGLCPHGSTYDHDSSPQGSPIILVSGDITFIPKFEGGHPERGC